MSQLYTPSNAPISFDATAPAPSITGMVPPTSGSGDKNPLLKCAAPVFTAIHGTVEERMGLDFIDVVMMGYQVDGKSTRSLFVPGTKFPICTSANGDLPDPNSANPQAQNCSSCMKNQSGSAADGKGKACAFGTRIAVVNASNPVDVLKMRLTAGSMLGDSRFNQARHVELIAQARYSLVDYLKFLAARNTTADAVITRIAFDEKAKPTANKVTFQAVAHISAAMREHLNKPEFIDLAKLYTSNEPSTRTFTTPAPAPVAAPAPAPVVDQQGAVMAAMQAQMAEMAKALAAAQAAAPAPVAAPAPAAAVAADPFAGIVWDNAAAPPAWAQGFSPV